VARINADSRESTELHPQIVILSEVVVREANDNAVEGSLPPVRLRA